MADNPPIKRDIHGFIVLGDETAKKGMDYLDYSIQYAEAKVFFDEAKIRGEAQFEDAENRNFTLHYNGDGSYTMTARKASGGGFFGGWF